MIYFVLVVLFMFKKVLVPTDFSAYAHKMQECLSEIPGIEEIVLLNVIDASNPMNLEKRGWSYSSLIEEGQVRLVEQADRLVHLGEEKDRSPTVRNVLKVIVAPMSGADGVNLQWPPSSDPGMMIEGGSVAEAIIRTAKEEKASLVCMGAQGKGLAEGMLLGSVSTEVLRKGETDLLIFRYSILAGGEKAGPPDLCRNILTRVMVATDFSPAAGAAVSRAEGLCGTKELMLVNVIAKDEEFGEAAAKLNLLRERLASPGRTVSVHVLQGRPTDQILSLAEKKMPSLILMGSQGKSWSRQIRVGSTTFDVTRRTSCPVMVIRPMES